MRKAVQLVFIFFTISNAFSHGADAVSTGIWHKKVLEVKWDSNWPTEHCMEIKSKHTLSYSIETQYSMKYDFHVHPDNKENEYRTEYFSKANAIKSKQGQISTEKPGTYCFNFSPVTRLKKNSEILLSYRVD